MTDELQKILADVAAVDPSWRQRAEARQAQLTKPPGSLGRLEEIAGRMCAIQQTLAPRSRRRRVVIFAADHGVAREENVSAYPPEVTRQMVLNFCGGGAAINAIAGAAGAEIDVADIGIAGQRIGEAQRGAARFYDVRVRKGTNNMTLGAAMNEVEMFSALRVGVEFARGAADEEVALVGLGEMGIGNTTAASAVTAALTGLSPSVVTGRGTGADDQTFACKIHAIERALAANAPDPSNPLDVLHKVGGLEIAGLCGLCLGAAAQRIAIVADGFIATAGAALAVRLCPAVADYLFAAHLSVEPGHAALLELINQKPLLDLNLRLGEGTGAALAMNLIGAALDAFNHMSTFEQAGVSDGLDAARHTAGEAV